jgi:hypothetical protein
LDWSAFGDYSTFLYANEAEKIINEKKNSKNPFFLYLPFQSVHFPLEVPEIYKTLYPNEKDDQRRTFMAMISVE